VRPGSGGRWLVTSDERDPGAVERLLGLLPHWFGIEAANAEYVRSARELQTYLARPTVGRPGPDPAGTAAVGVMLVKRHFPESAEIHLLAVDPSLHRQGVGRALVGALESDLIADGCKLLQVKTLGPSREDAGYALTRQFYAALGFLPVEEIADLWDPESPCLIMIKPLRGR
jgi:GNAT superfamily N-acetyltransferase